MAKKFSKTNAMRQLDTAAIPYEYVEYEYDEEDLSGVHAASEVGCLDEEMFKTLVARGDNNELFVFVIPVAENLDLKKAAATSGNKRVELIHVKELVNLTGYMRGGCSPIGMKKQFPTLIDETALLVDRFYVSGGRRGLSLIIDPEVLVEFLNAEFADLTM